jgi:hypothetical protein
MNNSPRRWRAVLALAVAALAGRAAAEGFEELREGTVRHGGDEVWLEVSLPAVGEWEELELYLVLDGGVPVRLTPCVDARSAAFRFPLPNLPVHGARFVVRAGADRDGGRLERDIAVSPPFTIRERSCLPDVPHRARSSGPHGESVVEWWVGREAPPEECLPLPAALGSASDVSTSPERGRDDVAIGPAGPARPHDALSRASGPLATGIERSAAGVGPAFRPGSHFGSFEVPLRN